MTKAEKHRPLRLQSKDLVLEELQDELMIYDSGRSKAFCLNRTAAFVWKHANGKTSVAEMVERLREESDTTETENEEVIWLALDVLAKDGLLAPSTALPTAIPELTRRKMLQRLGVGAMAVPVVTALFVSPAKAHASATGSSVPPPDPPTTTQSQGGGFWKWLENLF